MAVKGAGLGSVGRFTTRRQATRDTVVDTALRLFTERGYLGVRVEDIASEAGVSRATFYKHFAEREEILAELFERLLGTETESSPAGPAPTGSTEDQVTAAIEAAARQMLQKEQLARFIYSLPVRHSTLLRPGARSTPGVLMQVGRLLEHGLATGEIHNDLPVDLLTRHVHAALETAMRDWAEDRTAEPIAHLRALLGLAFHGIDSAGRGPRRST
jgi:AcrR family transcriptional regulator